MLPVGVIGTGLMGTAIIERLVQAGFEVLIHDIDEVKSAAAALLGARVVKSLSVLAERCGVIVLAVFNTEQVEQVIEGENGILDAISKTGLSPILICTSTCDPDRLASLAVRVAPHSLRLLEVPISGTSGQVSKGEGVGLVGGARIVMDEAAPVLDVFCPRRHYLGILGNGSRAKLAVNLILGLNRAAIAEGLVFAERLGLDRETLLEVARESAAYSSVMDTKGRLMAKKQFTNPQSRVDQSLKDFRLMLELASTVKQELPFAVVYAQLLEACMEKGQAGFDNAVIVEAIACRRRQ